MSLEYFWRGFGSNRRASASYAQPLRALFFAKNAKTAMVLGQPGSGAGGVCEGRNSGI